MNKKLKAANKSITKGIHPADFTWVNKKHPLVGVLITPRTNSRSEFPVGKDSSLKKEMVVAAHRNNIFLYFFYPDGFESDGKHVCGFTFQLKNSGHGRWIHGIFPMPDIVYNRLSFRKNERQKQVQSLLKWLEGHPRVHLFNSRFLNKWEVHNALSQNPDTTELVPESRLFNRENLCIMLCKYNELFVKPVAKSIGKGIIKIRRSTSSDHWAFKLAKSKGPWKVCSSSNQLFKQLQKTMDPKEKYLIQKGIDLAKVNGRVFDLRTEVQKNGKGQWVMTGVGVRIAAKGRFVTHVPNGGTRAVYNHVVRKVFGKSKRNMERLNNQLEYMCNCVPVTLEKGLGISLGILSFDVGIDKSGIMQIIEVNSKPSSFDEDNIRKKHLDNLNAYFLYMVNSSERLRRGD